MSHFERMPQAGLSLSKPHGTPARIHFLALDLAMAVDPVADQRTVAIVHRGQRVLAIGWAQRKSHPLQAEYGRYMFLHAEIDAIADAQRHEIDLHSAELYVLRIKPSLTVGLAKPCEHCMEAIRDFGFLEVRWSE